MVYRKKSQKTGMKFDNILNLITAEFFACENTRWSGVISDGNHKIMPLLIKFEDRNMTFYIFCMSVIQYNLHSVFLRLGKFYEFSL